MLALNIALIFLGFGAASKIIRMPIESGNVINGKLLKGGSEPTILYHSYNTHYYGRIGLGTPQQNFTIAFDTGYGDLWVISSVCSEFHEVCRKHKKYDSSKSHTYIADNKKFYLTYGYGKVHGFRSIDTLHVAGMEIYNQTFGEAVALSHHFKNTPLDGVFGLAFNNTAIQGALPPFYKMYEQGLIDSPEFSVYIARDYKHSKYAGELIFGGTNSDYYTGQFNYVPVLSNRYWTVFLEDVVLGSKSFGDASCFATIFTGTSIFMGPKNAVKSMVKSLGGRWSKTLKMYTVPCSRVSRLPPLKFTINNFVYSFDSEEYILKLDVTGKTSCALALLELGFGKFRNRWLFGSIFIQKYYTTFDIGKKRIGFAEAVRPPYAQGKQS